MDGLIQSLLPTTAGSLPRERPSWPARVDRSLSHLLVANDISWLRRRVVHALREATRGIPFRRPTLLSDIMASASCDLSGRPVATACRHRQGRALGGRGRGRGTYSRLTNRNLKRYQMFLPMDLPARSLSASPIKVYLPSGSTTLSLADVPLRRARASGAMSMVVTRVK